MRPNILKPHIFKFDGKWRTSWSRHYPIATKYRFDTFTEAAEHAKEIEERLKGK